MVKNLPKIANKYMKTRLIKILLSLFFVFCGLLMSSSAQSINEEILEKYRNKAEQEKVFDRQISLLQIDIQTAQKFKKINFHYTQIALKIFDEGENDFSKAMKLRSLKKEHSSKIEAILTPKQYVLWEEDRAKNGIIKQIMNK